MASEIIFFSIFIGKFVDIRIPIQLKKQYSVVNVRRVHSRFLKFDLLCRTTVSPKRSLAFGNEYLSKSVYILQSLHSLERSDLTC